MRLLPSVGCGFVDRAADCLGAPPSRADCLTVASIMTSPTQAVSSVQAMRDRVWFWLMCYSRIDLARGMDSVRVRCDHAYAGPARIGSPGAKSPELLPRSVLKSPKSTTAFD